MGYHCNYYSCCHRGREPQGRAEESLVGNCAAEGGAVQAATKLATVKTVSQQHEARVAEVHQELKDTVMKCEALEQKSKDQGTELTLLRSAVKNSTKSRLFRNVSCTYCKVSLVVIGSHCSHEYSVP